MCVCVCMCVVCNNLGPAKKSLVGTANNHGGDENTKSLQEFADKPFQSKSDPEATSHEQDQLEPELQPSQQDTRLVCKRQKL